ncbi:PP2C family serine/threonine-protein phosphatase [Chryseobacterium sp.]|uniref:PP2C family serine/threonine-protein phosphatase n=1 Tax=Chryseobacterium sp. TaxID=1871047 RepID=UPI00388F5CB3
MHQATEEFLENHFIIPNAFVNKNYRFVFDLSLFPNITIIEVKNLDKIGLHFEADKKLITGFPTHAGSTEIEILFKNNLEDPSKEHLKKLAFIVNADPKDLWQNKPSPKDDIFYKQESASHSSIFLDKKIVISSKRGRSHAHTGTFREDHFALKNLKDDWSIIALADGAGSAKLSRVGSQLATENIIQCFDDEDTLKQLCSYSEKVFSKENYAPAESKNLLMNSLYQKVLQVHQLLHEFAHTQQISLKDLHTTLIFVLIKKLSFGYVVLSFGVGDCPIAIINKDNTCVKLLNYLDVGESSGSTRFLTMPEIFSDQEMMARRFGINCFEDFSKLFLMTDGIYDPKFVVESKLENINAWQEFLSDMDGNNEDQKKVNFKEDDQIEKDLSEWMDFWSKGNHDDRTLAIIY